MNKKAPAAALYTLGCRVNQYESDAIAEILQKDGFTIVPFGEPCDIIIVNTCTVTAESDRKSRQITRRAASLFENVPVIVTGCFSQVSAKEVPLTDGVAYVCGNGEKDKIPAVARELIENYRRGQKATVNVTDIDTASYDSFTLTVPHRTRSYIKIEDGCENRCSYCIIPKARGKVRSKREEVALSEAASIASTGSKEIIFTGIETASYGRDLYPHEPYGTHLAQLLRKSDGIEGIERIGLGSLEPTVMSEAFVETIVSLRHILPHFHLSIQSGSTTVLNRMKRRYTAERALECIMRMKKALPSVTFSADVIVGFPGETDAEFEETLDFCKKVGFLHLHIFPYSVREGTEAAEMTNQVLPEVKHERLKTLEAAQAEIKFNLLKDYVSAHAENNNPVYVLAEKTNNGVMSGHSEHFVEVFAPIPTGAKIAVGEIVPVALTETNGDICRGSIILTNADK